MAVNEGIPVTEADIPTGLKCIKVYIPDGTDVHLYSLRGQLSNLGKPWFWDTGGDVDLARVIAGWWIAASEATDMTAACEECEDVNVNVNVNCCCNGSQSTNLVCYDQNGQPIINTGPVTPDDQYPPPTGEDWPMNPGIDAPPPTFDTWNDYDQNACAAANALWSMLVWAFRAFEHVMDLLEDVPQVIIAVAVFFPSALATAIAESAWLAKAAEWLLRLSDYAEDAKEYITAIREFLEENQQELVCRMYTRRHDIPGLKFDLVNRIIAYIETVFTLEAGDLWVIRQFLQEVIPFKVFMRWFTESGTYVAAIDPIDCSACVGDWTWGLNTGNGDGTLAIEYQTETAVFFSGLIPKAGSTQVQGFAGIVEGLQPVSGSIGAMRFFIEYLYTAHPNGWAQTQFEVRTVDMQGLFTSNPVQNKTGMIKNGSYVGPVDVDYVVNGTLSFPALTNDPSSAVFALIRVSVPQTQFNVICRIRDIEWLDINGDPIEMEAL